MARIKSPQDLGAAIILGLLGIGGLYFGREYDVGTASAMGPGYMPVMLSGGLILFGIIVGIRSLSTAGSPAVADALASDPADPLVHPDVCPAHPHGRPADYEFRGQRGGVACVLRIALERNDRARDPARDLLCRRLHLRPWPVDRRDRGRLKWTFFTILPPVLARRCHFRI